jgi:hypothetical protein
MLRLLALSTTALVTLSLQAAASPIVDNAFGAVIDILPGEKIDENGVAVNLGGDLATLNNEGEITSRNNDAVNARGDLFTLNNSETGLIEAGRKGVEINGDDPFVTNAGIISAVGDALEANVDGFELYNEVGGIVSSFEFDDEGHIIGGGRGVQTRGFGGYVENDGVIEAFDEALEARDEFTLRNNGIIDSLMSDGVQFAGGAPFSDYALLNEADGVIVGSSFALLSDKARAKIDLTEWDEDGDGLPDGDGVDFDEGKIINQGTITTLGSGAGIDVDSIVEPAEGPSRPAGDVTIENSGEISGKIGILFDDASTANADISNDGLIEGFGGVAVQFAPGQGETRVTINPTGSVVGDIIFGDAGGMFEALSIETEGDLLGGGVIFGASEIFASMDLLSLVLIGDIFTARYETSLDGGRGFFRFSGLPSDVCFNNGCFDADDLAGIAPVPLPAAGWLLLAGIGGLAALRRRA